MPDHPPRPTFASLFAGIGGFDLGLTRAGWHGRTQVEIDPACRTVLARHFPEAGRHDDVTTADAATLGTVDLLCGGFPCQDLSVAGRRAGLAGERSGPFHQFVRLAAERAPRWLLIENVPGLLSSHGGRDMALVLGALEELGYGWAYRVLDAQYFGLAQRRQRVFIVGCLGDSARAAQVLFESASGGGHPPPRREAGQDVTGTLTGGAAGGSTHGKPSGSDRRPLIPDVSYALTARAAMDRPESGSVTLIPALAACVTRREGKGPDSDATTTLIPSVAATLRVPSHGAAWRGDGCDNLLAFDERVIPSPGNRSSVRPGDPAPTLNGAGGVTVAYQCQGTNVGEMGTLRRGNGHVTGGVPFLAYGIGSHAGSDGEASNTSHAKGGPVGFGIVEEGIPALRAGRTQAIAAAMAVRRLTPTECERLQGFPDGWTEGHSDSTRYRQLGNAVAVPCAQWIGRRILEAS